VSSCCEAAQRAHRQTDWLALVNKHGLVGATPIDLETGQ